MQNQEIGSSDKLAYSKSSKSAIEGILFEFNPMERKLEKLNKTGLDILGIKNLSALDKIDITKQVNKRDMAFIRQHIKKLNKPYSNLICCIVRVKNFNQIWESFFVKFHISVNNNYPSINGIAHTLTNSVVHAENNHLFKNNDMDMGRKFLFDSLTPREEEILRMICIGATNQEIAQQLSISIHTVQTHRKRIKKKLKANTSVDLYKYKQCFI